MALSHPNRQKLMIDTELRDAVRDLLEALRHGSLAAHAPYAREADAIRRVKELLEKGESS